MLLMQPCISATRCSFMLTASCPKDRITVHLASRRSDQNKPTPVISGTSLAGAIRGRAYRIVNAMKGEATSVDLVDNLVDGIFGRRHVGSGKNKPKPTGSRLLVREAVIKNGISDRVQNRVKIDRFTGGAYAKALFSQQPDFC